MYSGAPVYLFPCRRQYPHGQLLFLWPALVARSRSFSAFRHKSMAAVVNDEQNNSHRQEKQQVGPTVWAGGVFKATHID